MWVQKAWKCVKWWRSKNSWNEFLISWMLGLVIVCPSLHLRIMSPDVTWREWSIWIFGLPKIHVLLLASLKRDYWTSVSIWLQFGLNMASAWNQYGSNLVVLSGSSQICHWTEDVAEKIAGLIQTWMLSCLMWPLLVFRYIDGAGGVTWILWSELSLVIPAVNGMKKNWGLCQNQWSSSVTERADRTRAPASVFTQVCVAACQLLENNIESRLKAKLYVQTWEGESVLYKNGSVYYFLKAIQGWALPKKQASLIVPALHSHTPTFPYLATRQFPQSRWFR